jgi:hypothetical protein
MSDGSTVDVSAVRDDSDLRAAILEHTKAERIAGVTQVDLPKESPKKPVKQVAPRTTKVVR